MKKIKCMTCLHDKDAISKQSQHLFSLNSETQELWLQLQMQLELHQEHMKQLLRKSIKEQKCCLESEKGCHKVYSNMNYTHQKCSLYHSMRR